MIPDVKIGPVIIMIIIIDLRQGCSSKIKGSDCSVYIGGPKAWVSQSGIFGYNIKNAQYDY